jgi:hypothetical protein
MVVCLRRLGFGCCSWGVGLSLICYRSGQVWFWLFAYGVGLSLLCYRSISFAPVRGGTYFSLPAAKKSRQKKAGLHRQPVGVHLGPQPGTAQDKTCLRIFRASDKALIHPTPHYVRRGRVCTGRPVTLQTETSSWAAKCAGAVRRPERGGTPTRLFHLRGQKGGACPTAGRAAQRWNG